MQPPRRGIPWLFVTPALGLVLFFLVYPTAVTVVRSFFGRGSTTWR